MELNLIEVWQVVVRFGRILHNKMLPERPLNRITIATNSL